MSIVDSFEELFVNGKTVFLLNETLKVRQFFGCDSVTIEAIQNRKENATKMIDLITALYYSLRVARVRTDGLTFRLHFITTILILTFSAIVSSKQFVGHSIECLHTREISVEAFNTYCWIHSTYFLTDVMLGTTGLDVAAAGIAPSRGNRRHRQGDNPFSEQESTKSVKYYQWVVFVLILQVSCVFFTALYLDRASNKLWRERREGHVQIFAPINNPLPWYRLLFRNHMLQV